VLCIFGMKNTELRPRATLRVAVLLYRILLH